MASKGQKFKKIPLEIKLEALNERKELGRSYSYIAKKYGVSYETVRTWARINKRDGGLEVSHRGRPKKEENINYKQKYEILKKYQRFLKEVDQERK